MTDNELIQLFLPIIKEGLISDGFDDVTTIQNNQPTQQGLNSNPTVYYSKVGSKLFGYRGAFDTFIDNKLIRVENQWIESTWQIGTTYTQNPKTPNQYTASDLAQEVAYILQSYNTVVTLNRAGVGIYRITNIINPYFLQDRDQYYAFPNFSFTLTYLQSRTGEVPVVTYPIKSDLVRI